MGRIYAKAQKDKMNQDLDEILAMLDDMKGEDFQISRQKILDRLEKMMAESEKKQSGPVKTESGRDFSREKTQYTFAEDSMVRLCPFSSGDERFYFLIREQYRIFEKNVPEEQLIAGYWTETQKNSAFYCVIERMSDRSKLGYIALKDTSKDLWEIAIELDSAHCQQGYGARAIMLFLQKVKEITGENQFRFLVEVDNIPCQNCMKKIKAKLVGVHNFAFDTKKEAEAFEERHLELLTDHMKTLAEELDITPRKLLSHVLDYRLDL